MDSRSVVSFLGRFNSLHIPPAASAISLFILLVQVARSKSQKHNPSAEAIDNVLERRVGLADRIRTQISASGGGIAAIFKAARLSACITLLCLSLHVCFLPFPPNAFVVGLCVAYTYTVVLSCLTLSLSARWNQIMVQHANCVLLVTWLVFITREVLPLAFFTGVPTDRADTWVFLTVSASLTFAALIVPLLAPRPYSPYDPKNPMLEPNEEDRASLLSLWLFSFVDPLVSAASHTSHLPLEQFPALSDRYWMRNLMKAGSKHITVTSATRRRHIFWTLLRLSAKEHLEAIAALSLLAVAGLIEPYAVNRTLAYLESAETATVRPWIWIICLFVGPMVSSITVGQFFSVVQNMVTRLQGIMSQVLFEYALRISSKDHHPQDPGRTVSSNTKPKGDNVFGNINNLITTDLNALETGNRYLLLRQSSPSGITLSVIFLYSILGWSVVVGILAMIVMLSLPGFVTKKTHGVQVHRMKKSDARVQTITESLGNAIRMIKLFGWEAKSSARIDEKRQEELTAIRNFKLLSLIAANINTLIPVITMIVTYATYTVVMKQSLTASRVFPSMTVFMMLQLHFGECSAQIPETIQAKVSLDRIHRFLSKAVPPDSQTESPEAAPTTEIGLRAVTISWDRSNAVPENDVANTESANNFQLHIPDEVIFKRGRINLIVGQTGSGKTAMLMALLGEMYCEPQGPNFLVSLPRHGGIAYHAQESWVLSETIKANILFGSAFDEERYRKVIYQCALEQDLALFAANDETEIGERGITLSLKFCLQARVTLARAVYSAADILLLDDVLAALDVHTARWIVEKCFKGDLVKGRTVILVTHNLALVSPIADNVVALRDGRVISQGLLATALERDNELSAEALHDEKEVSQAESDEVQSDSETKAKDGQHAGKLVVKEEVAEGHVSWRALNLFFSSTGMGLSGVVVFWILFLLPAFMSKMASVLDNWVLGLWAGQYESHEAQDVSVTYYLSLYTAAVTTALLLSSLSYVVFVFGTLRASRIIHRLLIDSILNSTLRWLDQTPTSRIIARCTQDIAAIDGILATSISSFVNITFGILVKLGAVILMSPIFAIPGLALCAIGYWLGQIYMRAQLAVKRERSNARAPVLGHFSTTIQGVVSIRAYGAQDYFRQESYKRLDRYTRASVAFYNLNRWIGIRGELLAASFSTTLAAYLVYGQGFDASRTGFSLTMAISFSKSIIYWVRYLNQLEVQGNSLERVQQYLEIDQEPKSTPEGVPPAYWPASGELVVEDLCARYSDDGPEVLHNLTFRVKSGERVGIVGRTGSGKSSLTLALLRAIKSEGKVFYDGISTDSINLDALRSNITIIPQVPELLTGTLRDNIDPFSQFDDAALNATLRAAGLSSLQGTSDDIQQLTLDSAIDSGGSNMSVGLRQIIALARAILRRSKILILDEATSAIDYETDSVIQDSLRNEVAKDVTLLTVAHRLQTIMDYDKIMVLDAGNIVEFGRPVDLLRNGDGVLRALVNASADSDKLYAMVSSNVAT